MSTDRCIFCLKVTGPNEPVEHIVPEGLIGEQVFYQKIGEIIVPCNQRLVLVNGEVCGSCNRHFGQQLDSHLITQFGLLRTFWNRVGTKSGNPATAARAGMYAKRNRDGPHIILNAGVRAITAPDGVKVLPASGHPMSVRSSDFHRDGPYASVRFTMPMRLNKRFVRGLHKIAFELLCLQKGRSLVLASDYDPVRDYVLRGKGSREIVFTTSAEEGTWERPWFYLDRQLGWPGYLVALILGVCFYIDLSPGNSFFLRARREELVAASLMRWSDRDGGRQV
jgi:hypothetical protein